MKFLVVNAVCNLPSREFSQSLPSLQSRVVLSDISYSGCVLSSMAGVSECSYLDMLGYKTSLTHNRIRYDLIKQLIINEKSTPIQRGRRPKSKQLKQ